MRLVGTTKPTIDAIRNRTHWNANNLAPMDPVTLGLCAQIDLDFEVEKAAKLAPPQPDGRSRRDAAPGRAKPRRRRRWRRQPSAPNAEREAEVEADAVFAKLKSMKGAEPEDGRRLKDSRRAASSGRDNRRASGRRPAG